MDKLSPSLFRGSRGILNHYFRNVLEVGWVMIRFHYILGESTLKHFKGKFFNIHISLRVNELSSDPLMGRFFVCVHF